MRLAKIFIPLLVACLVYAFSTSAQAIALKPGLLLSGLQAVPAALLYKNANVSAQVQGYAELDECQERGAAKPATCECYENSAPAYCNNQP